MWLLNTCLTLLQQLNYDFMTKGSCKKFMVAPKLEKGKRFF